MLSIRFRHTFEWNMNRKDMENDRNENKHFLLLNG